MIIEWRLRKRLQLNRSWIIRVPCVLILMKQHLEDPQKMNCRWTSCPLWIEWAVDQGLFFIIWDTLTTVSNPLGRCLHFWASTSRQSKTAVVHSNYLVPCKVMFYCCKIISTIWRYPWTAISCASRGKNTLRLRLDSGVWLRSRKRRIKENQ